MEGIWNPGANSTGRMGQSMRRKCRCLNWRIMKRSRPIRRRSGDVVDAIGVGNRLPFCDKECETNMKVCMNHKPYILVRPIRWVMEGKGTHHIMSSFIVIRYTYHTHYKQGLSRELCLHHNLEHGCSRFISGTTRGFAWVEIQASRKIEINIVFGRLLATITCVLDILHYSCSVPFPIIPLYCTTSLTNLSSHYKVSAVEANGNSSRRTSY